MHVMFKNVQQLSADWASAAQISLFLELSLSASDAEELAVRLRQRSDVRAVQLISREQALEEFRRYSGLREALDALAENPLPAVLSVVPAQATPQGSHALAQSLGQIEGVKQAQLDTEWVERLFQWLQLGQRVVMLLVFLLSVAVLLVVGNTIRLTIEGAREEIAVIKLVGGTDGFVRRPFLYTGFWFGLAGGVIAWLLVSLSLWWLQGPVARLSSLYRADFRLIGLDLADTGALLLFATVLGLSGAWLAVGRHLREVEFR
jgi:cell division transport system permease protein